MYFNRSQKEQPIGTLARSLRRHFGVRSARRRASGSATRLAIEQLEPRLALAGVVINEFLALNTKGITDQDGDHSDWIELKNTDATPADIGGWYLADSVDQWQFPSITIAPNGYLLVFASGKNRAVAGQELHTNFQLSGDGESLSLLSSDGVTVVHAYDPFPPQVDDVSYGLGAGSINAEPLVGEFESAQLLVPANGGLGDTWTASDFDDSAWLTGDTPIGYERSPGGSPDYNNYFQFDVNALMPAAAARDSIYMRIAFNVSDVQAVTALSLRMLYDDGFVAYLNGQEIARRNFTGTPAWNSSASSTHSDNQATVYEAIDVTAHLNQLLEGANVLSVQGLNGATNRSDFLIGPMLMADRAAAPLVGYMVVPSPGNPNFAGTLGFIADTKFSMDRGFYDAPFMVEITTATPGAQIRYTTDGSQPSVTTGLVYDPSNPPLISSTTTLRAAAFKAGFTASNVDTQTYVFLDDVLQQDGAGLPPYSNWGHAGPDWAMDPEVVNNPLYAGTIKSDLQSVPTVSLVMPWATWFGNGGIYISGESIERPGSMELFTADGSEEFQTDAALEIVGGTSTIRWRNDKLSIRVNFKPPFGATKLNTPLFVDPFFDQGAAVEFDTFILDAVYNHSWAYGGGSSSQQQRDTAKYIQDQFVADLQNLAGGHAPHGRYVHLYLNGLYWGMYYLHERPDEHFAESYLGGNSDDYDVIKHSATQANVVNGDTTAVGNYNSLLNAARQNMAIPANYAAVEQLLAVDEFIDYMLINYYVGNEDWAHQNWYATFNRIDPDGRWRFHSWDAEHVLESLTRDSTSLFNNGGPTEIHNLLMANPEYRLRFADRVQKHFSDGGVLSPETAAAIYAARMQNIDRAIVGESARWGDSQREPAYTRADWLATQNGLLTTYFPNRSRQVQNQFASRGWLVPLVAPVLSQYGGTVSPGFELTLSKPPGSPAGAQVYYTLDGSDPRNASTKLPSASALPYSGAIVLNAGTQVRARVFYEENLDTANDWSAVVDATFLLQTSYPVRITELHYHPADHAGIADDEDLEFIELLNTGNQTVSLNGVRITQFASSPYSFTSGQNLEPGERIVVARNPAVFQSVYGTGIRLAPTGYGTANLSNTGERIALIGPVGETLQDFVWDDVAPWPTAPDGNGPSLEIIDPLGDPGNPANWRASTQAGGSPGAAGGTIPGDYDGNAIVNDADFLRWRASFGLAVPPGAGADGNGDGVVDAADYVVWRKAATAPSTPASGNGAAAVVSLGDTSDDRETPARGVSLAAAVPSTIRQRSARQVTRPAFHSELGMPRVDGLALLSVELNRVAADAVFSDTAHLPPWVAAGNELDAGSRTEVSATSLDETAVWEDLAWLSGLTGILPHVASE